MSEVDTATVKHDPATCPTCAPFMARAAYRRGVERAKAMAIPAVIREEEPAR